MVKRIFRIYFLIVYAILSLISCKTNEAKNSEVNKIVINQPQTVEDYIEELLKDGKTIQALDLSGKKLTEVPDLSKLKIITLNLSNNQLTSIDFSKLPDSLNLLDISHNEFTGNFLIKKEEKKVIDTLNISYNDLNYVSISSPIYKLDVSYNDATIVSFDHSNIEYLDISYNKKHSNLTEFDPYLIKTIIRKGIANDKPLKAKWRGIIKD